MESSSSTFFDTNSPELKKAISDIVSGIAESSQTEKKELLKTLSEQVKKMNLEDLNLVINYQGLQKKTNKEFFIKLIEEAVVNPIFEKSNLEIIENALKSVDQHAIGNVVNNNKGPLDNLVSYFKSASANEKIGIASAVMVLGAALSPFIMLATLIALVAIGARYVGIGIGKAGEKIKEEAIEAGKEIKRSFAEAGKEIKSSYKNLIDKLPTIQAKENNFTKLRKDLLEQHRKSDTEEQAMLDNKIEIIDMLQNKEQLVAIRGLIEKDKIDLLSNLVSKGTSTHAEDMEKLRNFTNDFLPVIMTIGSNIKEVEQKVNEKAKEIKPSSEVITTVEPSQHSPDQSPGKS